MPKLFISQQWIDGHLEDKVAVSGDQMTTKTDNKAYRLSPAVHFVKVEGGDADPNQLLGKVKSEEELAKMGAEMMAESVIHGDTAYRVQPGFLAEFTGAGSPISSAFA